MDCWTEISPGAYALRSYQAEIDHCNDQRKAKIKSYIATLPEDKAMPYDDTAKMEPAQVEAPAPDKHVQLDNAIDSLHSVNSHLISLIRRIEGNDEPEAPSTARPLPALLDTLNEGPARIRAIECEAHQHIELLEGHLFR